RVEDPVVPALNGEVQKFEYLYRTVRVHEIVLNRVDRQRVRHAHPDAEVTRNLVDRSQQRGKVRAGIEAVGRGVLPRQLDFPYAMVDVPTDLRDDPIDGVRSDPPPGDPRDAIGATARASLGDWDDCVPPSE